MSDEYTKQLEAENAILREKLEKQDATIGEMLRKRLVVKKNKDGEMLLSLRYDAECLTSEEFILLTCLDVTVRDSGRVFPEMVINDLVSVQPMMSPTGVTNFMKWKYVSSASNATTPQQYVNTTSTSSTASMNTIAPFSHITMPNIAGKVLNMTPEEVKAEVEKIIQFNQFKKEVQEAQQKLEDEQKHDE
jgi:hypothetical protein